MPALAKRFTAPKPVNVLPVPVPLVNSIPFYFLQLNAFLTLLHLRAVQAINRQCFINVFSIPHCVGVPSALIVRFFSGLGYASSLVEVRTTALSRSLTTGVRDSLVAASAALSGGTCSNSTLSCSIRYACIASRSDTNTIIFG